MNGKSDKLREPDRKRMIDRTDRQTEVGKIMKEYVGERGRSFEKACVG
jgi:hypothetical protein